MTKSSLQERSYDFALRITNLSRYLSGQKHEFVLSKKLLDSGTSIGLCIGEGRQGFDRDDFRLNTRSRSRKRSRRTTCCVIANI